MKVIIGYPPLKSKKGVPLLAQNRQFQWAKTIWTAYPMVAAYAATMLKNAGHKVFWLDGISQNWPYKKWLNKLKKIKPDLVVIETKTPVIKQHWKIINELKKLFTNHYSLITILVGDHVTALPEESFKKSQVDYILTGGDWDFLLLNLVNHLFKKEKLEPGIYYRLNNKSSNNYKSTGKFLLNHDLNKLPFINRNLSNWQLYAYKNSNYCQVPGTYTMFSRDCWWGKCSFCSWTTLYPGKSCRTITVKRALDEIGHLLKTLPIKEIMDDSGTFPTNPWLRKFCQGMIKRGYHKKIKINCNMRFNAGLTKKDFLLMARAGFRFLLFGLESYNQKTLDKLNKNLNIKQVVPVLKLAKEANLYPHLTVMIGYPWETNKEIKKTLSFTKTLLKKGLIDSLQATIVIPYPGTPFFNQALKKNWLKTLSWNDYDMSQPVLKTNATDKQIKKLVQDFYKSIFSLPFILKKTKQALFDFNIFKYYLRLGFKFPSKLLDFKN